METKRVISTSNLIIFILLAVTILMFLFVLPWSARAQEPTCNYDAGNITCTQEIPPPPEEPPVALPPAPPPPCYNYVFYRMERSEDVAMCLIRQYQYDCDTGGIRAVNAGGAIAEECPAPPPLTGLPCEPGEWQISLTGISCGKDSGLGDILEVNIRFPEFGLVAYPYPATLAGWPSYIKVGNLAPAVAEATKDYVGRGGGDEDDPKEGDWRNIRFALYLEPVLPEFIEVEIPTVGRTYAIPDELIPVKFDLPSHTEAGGVVVPEKAGLVGLSPDFPAFQGMARAAYRLRWVFEYDRYEVARRRKRDANGNPICSSSGTGGVCTMSDGSSGRYEMEDVASWKHEKFEGIVDPTQINGLPSMLKADTNGDGVPDALWNYQVIILQGDEQHNLTGAVYRLGGLYWWVREAQGVVSSP